MKLLLKRIVKKETYTIGRIYVDGKYECDCIEDKDRHLTQDMPLKKILEVKVAAKTAIPAGTYTIRMDVISPKYSLKPWYIKNCHGARLPRFENIPGWSGVLFHCGNTAADSAGCLIIGMNTVVGMVTESKATFLKLYNKMYEAYKKGEKITVTIE